MTGLRKRTTWARLSLCATAATLLITISAGFASFIHDAHCVPVKLVADFPTFAATLLGSLGQDPTQQSPSLVTSSSSSSYLTNDQSDDDLDEAPIAKVAAAAADSPGGRFSKATFLADYELDLLEKIQSLSVTTGNINNNNSVSQQLNKNATTMDESEEAGSPAPVAGDAADVDDGAFTSQNASTSGAGASSNSSSSNGGGGSSTTLTLLGGGKKSHIIRLPNGQSFQFCDELVDLSCRDENAVCKMGACVCKPGFFLHKQSGLCQSISDLLKNCDNDYQCQAFDVDLVCDTKSHERSFCDCAEGSYFDQETYSCIPCHRNTFVLTTNNKELLKKLNQSQTDITALNISAATDAPDTNSTGTVTSPAASKAPTLRPCRPIDLTKLNHKRRKQQHQLAYSSLFEAPRGSSSYTTASTSSTSSTSYHPASSDPFRIKTPLEVFMGAIMLFTLLTVAWFFLQRMFHDCRVILRSLRNPDFTGHCPDGTSGAASHLTSIGPNSRPSSQLYLDPAGQAVARLLSNDGYNSSLAGIYQRDLAGVMVQHLAANLSPSSTNHALAVANGSHPRGENEINLYPLTISSQQSRSAAAAAAAQLLLSPSHPAIAILRAAAASANHGSDYNQTSILNSMLDPPPKYEEAIAQSEAIHLPSSYVPLQHDNQISSRASEDNNENREDNPDGEEQDEEEEEQEADAIGHHQTTRQNPSVDATNIDRPAERNDGSLSELNAVASDTSQPPAYQSTDGGGNVGGPGLSTASSNGPSESEQTSSRRQSANKRKRTRGSRRGGRGSTTNNRNSQQQQKANQDSDDTLTESD